MKLKTIIISFIVLSFFTITYINLTAFPDGITGFTKKNGFDFGCRKTVLTLVVVAMV